jgi:NitT/TauT family transport system substrate-binding protein
MAELPKLSGIRRRFQAAGLSISLAFGLILASCGTRPTVPEKRQVKVAVIPYLTFAPLFIAQDMGFFSAQGLEVEFLTLKSSAEAIPSLDTGKLDVVGGTLTLGVFNAIARGARIRIVADKGYVDPRQGDSHAFLARKDLFPRLLPVRRENWRGLNVAVNPVATSGYTLEKLLQPAGLSLEDLNISNLPDSVLPEAFKKKIVDIAEANDPWLHQILEEYTAVIILEPRKVVPGLQKAVLYYGPNLREKDPRAGERFMTAYLEGVRECLKGKSPRLLDIVGRHTGLNRDYLEKTIWPAFQPNGQPNLESVTDFVAWGIRKGHIQTPLALDQIWDGRFIKAAAPRQP